MPHYKDGTEAKVGDLIKGTGYNIKDANGQPAVISGTLIQITPNSDSCNLVILTTEAKRLDPTDPGFIYRVREAHDVFSTYPGGIVDSTKTDRETYALKLYREYGAIKDFELVHRPD
jgi:hypothetical protein